MTTGNIPPKGFDEDAWQPDAESLNALEAEIPVLAILRSFADEACRQPSGGLSLIAPRESR